MSYQTSYQSLWSRGRIRSPEQDEDYYEETDDWYDYLWLVFGYLDEDVKED